MSAARRGVATDQMKLVAKDEDVSIDWLLPKIARGSIIIPSNNARPQKIHNVGIGKGLKTKVNVNIGTSTLRVNLAEEIDKAKVAVKYHADTIMDLSDGGDVGMIRRTLLDAAPITIGTVPIYEAYNDGVEKYRQKNGRLGQRYSGRGRKFRNHKEAFRQCWSGGYGRESSSIPADPYHYGRA